MSVFRSTSPGTVSIAWITSAAYSSSVSKSSPEISIDTGAPVGGPSSSRSTVSSAPGTTPASRRNASISSRELVCRSAAARNST